MKDIKQKFIAGVSAAVLAASAVGLVPVNAIQVPADANGNISSFEYTVKTEKVDSTKVKVVFQIVNNPGINKVSVAVRSTVPCIEMPTQSMAPSYVESTGIAYAPVIFVSEEDSNFKMEFVYDISANPNKDYTFSLAVTELCSESENINYEAEGETAAPALDSGITFTSNNKTVMLGDADNSNSITANDAYLILRAADKGNNAIRTDVLNTYWKSNTNGWKTLLPNLPCAEAIDVDYDGIITEDDATDVLSYYSKAYAGSMDMNSLIGTKQALTVVYDA